jgi:hypothetical protein
LAGDCPKVLPKEDCEGMTVSFTPNNPLFSLHHAQLDRLWSSKVRFPTVLNPSLHATFPITHVFAGVMTFSSDQILT